MKQKLFLVLIVILAFVLRVWQVDKFPATLYGDEQAFSWNAYNILKLGQDEYGTAYPLQFRSFDDYKAPVPVYILVPFIKLLGLNSFAIRLPITLASVMTVFVTFLLARVFVNTKVSLIVSFLFAISPWHVHLSRGFFEATLALLWFILGIYFFIKDGKKIAYLLISMLFFTLSLYSYFVPRILVPLILIFLIYYGRKYLKGNLKVYILSIVFLFILALPLIKLSIFGQGFSRFNKLAESNIITVIQTVNKERNTSNLPENWRILFHNKPLVWMRLVKNNFLDHLSPNFWYLYGDNSLRYFTGNMGMFYLLEFPFLIIGLYSLWKNKREVAVFFLGWIILSTIPASLVGRPFAVRSLIMLPAPFVFVAYGIYKLLREGVARRLSCKELLPGVVTLGFIISIGSLLVRYYLEYPVYAATWWGWENKAALDYAKVQESQYDNIFISDFYTGATLAYAVYNQYDPLEYRKALKNPVVLADGRTLIKLGKYYFGSLDIDKNRLISGFIPSNSLYIGRPQEADSDETIKAPDDGRIIFKIYKTK